MEAGLGRPVVDGARAAPTSPAPAPAAVRRTARRALLALATLMLGACAAGGIERAPPGERTGGGDRSGPAADGTGRPGRDGADERVLGADEPAGGSPSGEAGRIDRGIPSGDDVARPGEGREERRDGDGDGVVDDRDDCPDTPDGEVVGEQGCTRFAGALEGVAFAPSDHRLDAASRLALRALVADLQAHPGVVLRIGGHTDNRGTASANLELSKRRVMSVARFLVANGVAPSRLKPYGYGESRPRAGNATEAGRERNRRIEIGQVSPASALAEPGGTGQNAADAE